MESPVICPIGTTNYVDNLYNVGDEATLNLSGTIYWPSCLKS